MDDGRAVELADADAPQGSGALRRLGWFTLIWAASVTALGVVALIIRMLMTLAGMRAG
jgi:Protein of unknown function (DUF2474)